MEKIINLGLFTVPNVIAIGAIAFFWWACVFALHNLDNDD